MGGVEGYYFGVEGGFCLVMWRLGVIGVERDD